MRNLKKVLVLVLCFAMILGIMVVGAGAAFTDQSSIDSKHTEAVDMCVALNIINGMPDGSFDPNGDVTREQMAKMICILDNGGKEPQGATGTTFSDVAADRWSNKYIESCAARGVVAGVGGGKFDPAGNVTGSQAAKMLLVELGYDQDIAKYTGAGWDTNVNIDATKKGFYDDLEDIDVSAPLSREHAAQMIWNALQANEVGYSYTLVTNPDGSISSKTTVEDKRDSLLDDKYGTETTEGILWGMEYNTKTEKYDYALYTEDGMVTFTTDKDFTDLFGLNVCFVAKDGDNTDVKGAYAKDSAVVVSGVWGDVDTDELEDGTLAIDDAEYDLAKEVMPAFFIPEDHEVMLCGGHLAKLEADRGQVAKVQSLSPCPYMYPGYFTFDAIDWDDDQEIDLVLFYPVSMGELDYIASEFVRVSSKSDFTEPLVPSDGKLSTKDNDYDVYDGAAKEDYVLVETDKTLKTLGLVSKMDEITGKVESVVESDATAVVDGTTYDVTYGFGYNGMSTAASKMVDCLDKEVTFYEVNGYMFEIDADLAASLEDFVILADIAQGAGLGGYRDAELVKADDGTHIFAQVKSADGAELKTDRLYTFDEEDGKYELTEAKLVADQDYDKAGNYGDNIPWAAADTDKDTPAKIDGNKFADDAIVHVKNEDGEYELLTGAEMAKVDDAAAQVYYFGADTDAKTNVVKVQFAVVSSTGTTSSDWEYGFVTSAVKTQSTSDGKYFTMTVWDGANSVDLTSKAKVTTTAAKGDVVRYQLNEDNKVTKIETIVGTLGAITTIDDPDIYIGTSTTPLTVDEDDTVVIYVNKSENAGAPADELQTADETSGGAQMPNVFYFDEDNDGTLEILVVDVLNDWNGLAE